MIPSNAINIDAQVLKIIAELDEFKGRWDSLGKLSQDKLTSLRRVATIESVGSSTRIEGARLSDHDVEALLANLEMHSFRSRDEEEVAGYAEAMNTIFDSWEHIPLTENHIKQLHGMLLKYSTKDRPHRGEYKKFPNNVEAFDANGKSLGVIFETATPFDTPRLMSELVDWTTTALREQELHPILVIAAFVVHFLAIHPFQDGNGRLSRVLTTLLLLKCGYLYVPYSSMERIVEENKDRYYRALRASQRDIRGKKENLDDWIRFFLHTLKKQKDVLLRKVERERLLMQLSQLSESILILSKERGRLTISEAVTLLSINRNTAKLHFRQLVHQGYLIQHGVGKATWYSPGK
ncbi:MAG: Fic family protein [Deltaproteobacteria bacterium]|nr:Fic family protein [Deltaproteobacteria bacterium]